MDTAIQYVNMQMNTCIAVPIFKELQLQRAAAYFDYLEVLTLPETLRRMSRGRCSTWIIHQNMSASSFVLEHFAFEMILSSSSHFGKAMQQVCGWTAAAGQCEPRFSI